MAAYECGWVMRGATAWECRCMGLDVVVQVLRLRVLQTIYLDNSDSVAAQVQHTAAGFAGAFFSSCGSSSYMLCHAHAPFKAFRIRSLFPAYALHAKPAATCCTTHLQYALSQVWQCACMPMCMRMCTCGNVQPASSPVQAVAPSTQHYLCSSLPWEAAQRRIRGLLTCRGALVALHLAL